MTNSGDLITEGDDAHGIFAQSVGGGGGVAGNVDRGLKDGLGPIPPLNVGLGLAFGQDGGSGGDGGAITVTNTSNIVTHGVGSFGIFAQSVGGGGGLAGGLGNENIPILEQQNFAGSVGGDGDAGAITITQNGDIVVLGDAADGIFAQSDATNGNSGAITIDVAGDIDAGGAHANGIRAQSQGDMSSGAIAVTITSGSVRGGTESGAAVNFIDGAANTLTNRGDIGRLDELDRATVIGGSGNESIENFGGLYGTLALGGGVNSFVNRGAATVVSGATIDIGAGGTARNEGLWSVGSERRHRTHRADGRLHASRERRAAHRHRSHHRSDRSHRRHRRCEPGRIDRAQSDEHLGDPAGRVRVGARRGRRRARGGRHRARRGAVHHHAVRTANDLGYGARLTLTTSFVPQDTPAARLLPNEKRIGDVHQRSAARRQLGDAGADDREPRRHDERVARSAASTSC